MYKPLKTSVTIRIDADVLAWFKSQGRGHLTRMNAVLREAMLRSTISEKD
nr:BrnA antitoxin family protein [uncultured Herbaspirillum sp.]